MGVTTAEVVICGAGIAGIAVAYQLAVKHNMPDVILVEQGDPLTLTSDKSTECYRNWWPGPGNAMVSFMNRSIDLLDELAHTSNNVFHLNRRGYIHATADAASLPAVQQSAEAIAALGGGELRVHTSAAHSSYTPAPAIGFTDQPDGADLILDPVLIRAHFPYLSDKTVGVLHTRRCGWFSGQQLGMYLLEQAREHGVRLVRGRVTGVDVVGGRVQAVGVTQAGVTSHIATPHFVNAAGPLQQHVDRLLGVDLPVFSERHFKLSFNDYLGVVPRDAGLLIWLDPITLEWGTDERAALAEDPDTAWLLNQLPAGVHGRPEGKVGSTVLLLWAYETHPVEPTFPLPDAGLFPEVVLRGMTAMLPGLSAYFDRMPRPYIDGGYYTKTRENRPLIGPLPVEGAYIVGALSGFGLMAAPGAAELIGAYLTGAALPEYAPALALARYADPTYQRLLAAWGDIGQL